MRIINDNLPPIIYEFLKTDFYDYVPKTNSLSATTCLKSTKEILLTRRYHDRIEIPASKRFHALFGSATHEVLNKLPIRQGIEKEQRIEFELDGFRISGKFDLVMDGALYDYKTTSFWTLIFKDRMEEWMKQLSIYRYLYFKTRGIVLNKTGYAIAILKDWSDSAAVRYKGCPKKPCVQVTLGLMEFDEVQNMLKAKITEVKYNEGKKDEELPDCTEEERWYSAKKKKSNKCDGGYCPAFAFCKQANKGD